MLIPLAVSPAEAIIDEMGGNNEASARGAELSWRYARARNSAEDDAIGKNNALA